MKPLVPLLAILAIGCAPPPTANNSINVSPAPGTTGSSGGQSGGFTLTSATFQNGGVIPTGGQIPDLEWSGLPAGTANVTLEVIDPDASNFVHWIVTNMDPASGHVTGGVSGKNGSGATGYYPPEPPPGETHHYHFKLYALDQQLQLDSNYELADLDKYMQGHILAQTEIVGTFRGQ